VNSGRSLGVPPAVARPSAGWQRAQTRASPVSRRTRPLAVARRDGKIRKPRDPLPTRFPGKTCARAVALLRRPKEQGWFKNPDDLLNLATDPDFKSLHGRYDFKKLLAPAGGDRPE
jgi:hypothetical protein